MSQDQDRGGDNVEVPRSQLKEWLEETRELRRSASWHARGMLVACSWHACQAVLAGAPIPLVAGAVPGTPLPITAGTCGAATSAFVGSVALANGGQAAFSGVFS